MTFWIVLCSILLGILLLLCAPVVLRVTSADGTLRAEINFFGLVRKRLYPLPKHSKKVKKRTKSRAEKESAVAPPKKNKDGSLRRLRELRSLIAAILIHMPRTFSLRIRRLSVRLASDDPAKTALLYGAVSSALAFSLAWLDRHLFSVHRARREAISVLADFEGERTELNADLCLRTSLGRLLSLGAKVLLPHFLKHKKSKKNKMLDRKKGVIPCQK